jgi:hypothetical protein
MNTIFHIIISAATKAEDSVFLSFPQSGTNPLPPFRGYPKANTDRDHYWFRASSHLNYKNARIPFRVMTRRAKIRQAE